MHKALEFEKAGTVPAFDANRNPEAWGVLPKKLDEEVARLHLGRLGVKLTTLTRVKGQEGGGPD